MTGLVALKSLNVGKEAVSPCTGVHVVFALMRMPRRPCRKICEQFEFYLDAAGDVGIGTSKTSSELAALREFVGRNVASSMSCFRTS